MTQHTVLVVGGEARLNKINLYPKLERAGLRVHERSEKLVYKRTATERQDRIVIPKEVDIVLALSDLMSHSIYNAAKQAAELAGKRFLGITRQWSKTQGYLKEAGLIDTIVEEEEMENEGSIFQKAEAVYGQRPDIKVQVGKEWLLKPNETVSGAKLSKTSKRYQALADERFRITKLFLENGFYRNSIEELSQELKRLGLGGADPRSWYRAKVELGIAPPREWKRPGPRKEVTVKQPPLLTIDKPKEKRVSAERSEKPSLHVVPKAGVSDKDRFSAAVKELREAMHSLHIRTVMVPVHGEVEVEITTSQSWNI